MSQSENYDAHLKHIFESSIELSKLLQLIASSQMIDNKKIDNTFH
jgi:hypothetical protein